MKWYFLFIIALFSSLKSVAQDNYDVEHIPTALLSRANAVIRNETIRIDMQATDNVSYVVIQAITVLNKNGESNAGLVLFYDKNTQIKSIKGEVYNSTGKLQGKFSQRDFSDESAVHDFSLFEDTRIKRYIPTLNMYPYTVVYQYEVLFKQNLILPSWFPRPSNDVSVEKSSYTFVSKPNDKLRIKTQNLTQNVEELITEKQKILTWRTNNLIATRSEPFSPDKEAIQTFVKIAPEKFSYYDYEATYKDWKDLGKWIYEDLLKDRSELPVRTVQAIKELVKSEKTKVDKARKIYQFLQEKTRYISVQIGIGGFKPFSAADVDRLGYGDCKALVNYMQSLLKAADIDSYYCIVNAGDEKKSLDPTFASMSQANHVILAIPFEGDTTWLECTNQKISFGFLSNFTDDRLVLACTPEGGKLLRTPNYNAQQNIQKRNANLFLDKNGNIRGDVTTLFKGTMYNHHEHIPGKSLSEQQKLLKQAYTIDNINFSSIQYVEEKDKLPQLQENLTVTIRNYGAVNTNKIFLSINPFPLKIRQQEVRNRKLPVYINRGYTIEDSISYTLSDEIIAALEPVKKSYQNKFGSYFVQTSLIGNVITYYRKFVLLQGTFPQENYEEFLKFMNNVNADDQLRFVFTLKL